MLVLDGVSFFIGMLFISFDQVIPVYLKTLGAPTAAVALIPLMLDLGINLPAVFVASKIEKMPRRKPFVIRVGILQRIPWMMLAVTSLLFAVTRPGLMSVLVLVGVGGFALATGISMPGFFFFVANLVPKQRRGRVFAIRAVGSYVFGLVAGTFVSRILDGIAFPASYALLFTIASAFTWVSLISIVLLRESPTEPPKREHSLRETFRRLPDILLKNRNFRRYLIGRILHGTAFAGTSYYAVSLVSRFALSDAAVGTFTTITAVTFVVVNPIIGALADRYGYRILFVISSAFLFVGHLLGALPVPYFVALATIVAAATARSVRLMGDSNMTLDFCDEAEVPTYISAAGLIVGPASLVILAIGAIAEHAGFTTLFIVAAITAALSFAQFAFFVREPRSPAHPDHTLPPEVHQVTTR